jgi:hypothetical protein
MDIYDNQEFAEAFHKTVALCEKKYGSAIAQGRHRLVFESQHCVIKIPLNAEGDMANCNEQYTFRKNRDDIYARCRQVQIGDMYVLFMEKVRTRFNPYDKNEKFPDWVDSIDCGQVGFNSKGKLVAYDFGG